MWSAALVWRIELSATAERCLAKLDRKQAERIAAFLRERIDLENPRSLGVALHGPRFKGLWRYRVGDYRLICQDDRLVVLVVEIGNRREVYRG
jgi:mRNA interferase RelE/StbE